MAIFKILLFVILPLAFVLHLAQSNPMFIKNMVQSPPPQKIDCDGACAARCQLSSRPNLCNRACGTCCARCGCVPPGTSGNYDVCPCYANMTTHGGRHKCP
ncbi:gibberellin-regulated protein 11-like [Mercurialis annua]|uniref:gibberellin-regulated protein 11-like n=1 Tax=Mercurialis annua TaxID=3986 RepID=UPI00216060CD|nr:gibberellin-regulated protein 11-like [Mercurialis annua]